MEALKEVIIETRKAGRMPAGRFPAKNSVGVSLIFGGGVVVYNLEISIYILI